MKTFEKNGNLYELRKLDSTSVRRVLIGPAEPQASKPSTTASTLSDDEWAPVIEAPADDLTEVKGIGPAAAKKLNEAGIFTFAELAASDHKHAAAAAKLLEG